MCMNSIRRMIVSNYQKSYTVKALNTFLENAFEIAFGDDAINKEYLMVEVINKLREHSDNAWKYEQLEKYNGRNS